MTKLREKLMHIQTEIKAPKNLYNSFGKYSYRNAEGICEAVKPYLEKEKCTLILKDRVIEIGERVYVEATAVLYDMESDDSIEVNAFAREELSRKGMDSAQITGATSSYARKYALNGLFLLDDTKDMDSNEYKEESERRTKAENKKPETKKPETKNYTLDECMVLVDQKGLDSNLDYFCKYYHVEELPQLSQEQLNDFFKNLAATPSRKKGEA